MTEDITTLQRDLQRAIREVQQLQEELRVTREEIERARQARAALVSLSQELRTPLNTIMGFSQLLKWRVRDEERTVEKILAAGCQMMEMIERIIPANADGTEPGLAVRPSPAADTVTDATSSILYVEDNVANYNLVERIMAQREKIRLFSAKRGDVALQLALESRPDLILLDLNLPDMHGTEVLRRLRADPATMEVPVVVISADASPSQIERLLAAGARNYLTKPFNIERLLYTVDEVLEEQARQRDRAASAAVTENP